MATSVDEDLVITPSSLPVPRSGYEGKSIRAKKTSPRGSWFARGMALVAGVAVIALTITLLRGMRTPRTTGPSLTHTVERGELLITVTENGNLESASNKDIKCQVEGGSTILWIVEDGTDVNEGDVVARLEASTIEEEIGKQKIAYQKARAASIQAESDLAVAKLGVQEYLDGTYRKELQLAQSNVAIAEENLRTAKNALEYSERMFRKGYMSALEMDARTFSVEHAGLELELKRTEEDVLRRFTKAKTLQDLQSKLDAAEAKMLSETASLELEEARLTRLQAQKDKCVVRAPSNGMVIYPERRPWSQEPEVAEGVKVRDQQTLMQLPDLSQMQVKVQVHESKVEQLKPGMQARIRIQDDRWVGHVESVANRAAESGWWTSNTKKFDTIVTIDGQPGLKPGMSAEVEILIARHEDVLTLPVASVVEVRGEFYCWVKTAEDLERRQLVLGPSNDQFIVVKDGVLAGEDVVLNPRAVVDEVTREALQPVKENDGDEKFGWSEPETRDASAP